MSIDFYLMSFLWFISDNLDFLCINAILLLCLPLFLFAGSLIDEEKIYGRNLF